MSPERPARSAAGHELRGEVFGAWLPVVRSAVPVGSLARLDVRLVPELSVLLGLVAPNWARLHVSDIGAGPVPPVPQHPSRTLGTSLQQPVSHGNLHMYAELKVCYLEVPFYQRRRRSRGVWNQDPRVSGSTRLERRGTDHAAFATASCRLTIRSFQSGGSKCRSRGILRRKGEDW